VIPLLIIAAAWTGLSVIAGSVWALCGLGRQRYQNRHGLCIVREQERGPYGN